MESDQVASKGDQIIITVFRHSLSSVLASGRAPAPLTASPTSSPERVLTRLTSDEVSTVLGSSYVRRLAERLGAEGMSEK